MSVRENAATIGIAVLFTTLVLVSIDAFYPRPDYIKYCPPDYRPIPYMDEVNCTHAKMTEEEARCYEEGGNVIFDYNEKGCPFFKECDFCSRDFQEANERYSNHLLLILAPLGAIAIILGVLYKIEFIGSGFMFAGIILMVYGTVQNFGNLNKNLRVVVVLLELLLILYIAYKKIVPSSKDSSKQTPKRKK